MDVTTKRPSFKRPSLSKDKDAERDQGKEFWNRTLAKLQSVDMQGSLIGKHRALIGKWVKAANKDFPALLAILDACEKAGTHDPVSYISAAVRDKFPPPEKREDPKDISESKWIIIRGVAIERREWAEAWGPPPGSKGCVMPKDLITPELLSVFKPQGAML